jgi:hypothetical protein
MARQAELTFLAINQSRTTKEKAMLKKGLHGAYELACADASANGFRMRRESPVPSTLSKIARPHIAFLIQKKGDYSVLDQIESRTLPVACGLLIQQITLLISIVYCLQQCALSGVILLDDNRARFGASNAGKQ